MRMKQMANKFIKVAFWFSDTWVSISCVICLIYAFTAPIFLPAYQSMNKIEHTGLPINIGISVLLLSVSYAAYRMRARCLISLIYFSIAVSTYSVFIGNWVFWLCIMPIVMLPYLFTFREALNKNVSA